MPTAAMLALIASIALLGCGRDLGEAVTSSASYPWVTVTFLLAFDGETS